MWTGFKKLDDGSEAVVKELIDMPLNDLSMQPVTTCKICNGEARLFDVVDFNKVCAEPNRYLYGMVGEPVFYHRCDDCGFIFTDYFDSWRHEDFARHIYNADYVKVDGDYVSRRPVEFAEKIAARFPNLSQIRILDFGSGSGALAARLCTLGATQVSSYDPYFQPERPDGKFDLVICLETIQHSPHPKAFIEDIKSFMNEDAAAIIATAMQPHNVELLRANWISIAPRNGHLSLYNDRSLLKLAHDNGFVYCEGNGFMGLVTPRSSPIGTMMAQAVGPVIQTLTLKAPGDDEGPAWRRMAVRAQWRDIEASERGRFRWTMESQIEWPIEPLPFYPSRVRVFIPVIMELVDGFAEKSAILIGGKQYSVTRTPSGVMAEFLLRDDDEHMLILKTPDLTSPDALGTAPGDKRKLGLGVPLGS